jgi:hypothetical protein
MSIKEIFNNVISAFDTHTKGFSARKLAAFTIIVMIVIAHIKWFKSDHWEYLGEVLMLDFGFISVCLGMTTWESITNKKNNIPPNSGPDTPP